MKKVLTRPQRALLSSLPASVLPNRPEVKALIAHGLAEIDRRSRLDRTVRLQRTERGELLAVGEREGGK